MWSALFEDKEEEEEELEGEEIEGSNGRQEFVRKKQIEKKGMFLGCDRIQVRFDIFLGTNASTMVFQLQRVRIIIGVWV